MSVTQYSALPKLLPRIYWLAETSTSQLAEVYRLEPDPNPVALFDNTCFVDQREQGPKLFSLSADGQMVAALLAQPEAFKGLLLITPHPVEQLIQQLQGMLSVTFSHNRKALLRFYDPLVASYLFSALNVHQLPRWLGPIQELFWYGGTWSDIASQGNAWLGLSQTETQASWPDQPELILTDAQERALARQSMEKFAYDWLVRHPGDSFDELLTRIQHGIASGQDEEASLTAWLQQTASQSKGTQG